MATNLIEIIQKHLDYPALSKVDPNSQDARVKSQNRVEKMAQGAIPAVLVGLYSLSRKKDGAEQLLNMQTNNNEGLLQQIFDGQEHEAVQKVAQYGDAPETDAKNHMEIIAGEAIKVIRQEVGEHPTADKIKTYLSDQRHNLLTYLPATMHFSDVLNDETLDDQTNKMEGPVSNIMHKIEDKLSGSGG